MRPQLTPKNVSTSNNTPEKKKPGESKRYSFDIVASQCKVCNLEPQARRDIDLRVASGWTQASILDHWNEILAEEHGPDYISKANLSTHARKHVSTREAAIRKVVEERARQFGLETDAAAEMILTKEGVIEAIIVDGLQNIIKGNTLVEPKELLLAIQTLKQFESEDSDVSMDEMWKQFYAFQDAVKIVCPPEMWEKIADQFERNLRASGVSFIEGARVVHPDRPELEAAIEVAEIVEVEEVVDGAE